VIKIKLKRIFSTMLVLTIATSTLVFADNNAFTMEDAIKTATANSLEVKRYTSAITRYERDINEAIISSRQLKDTLEMDERFRKLSQRGANRTVEEDNEFFMLQAALGSYMSFSQRLEMTKQSELGATNMEYMLNVSKNSLVTAKNNLYISVYKGFNSVVDAENAITIKSALIANLERDHKAATAKYAQGKLSLNNLKLVALGLEKAKIELNTLQLEKKKKIIELNKILKVAVGTTYDKYAKYDVQGDISLKPMQEYIDLALTSREDIKSAKKSLEIKQKEYDLTKVDFFYETSSTNLNAYIGLTNAKTQLENTEINAQLQVISSYNNLQNQLTNLQKAKLDLDLQDRNLLETKIRYSLGLTTELEVSNANAEYSQSQLDYLSASREAWLAKLNLEVNCGIIVNNN
jgi:hypothetical protein